MVKKRISFLTMLLMLTSFALLLILPKDAAAGAKKGLSVCGGVIVPSLFPFLVLSGLSSAAKLPEKLARFLGPFFRRLRIPANAAAPMLLGLMGGYPVGATAVAQLVRNGTVSPGTASEMLPYCNNTGPSFLIGAAGSAVFGSAKIGMGLYLCHILSTLTLALFFRRKSPEKPLTVPIAETTYENLLEIFPDCVRAAAASTINICAFVVFFSVLTALFRAAGVFSTVSAAISLRLGTELQFSTALLTGILELGSGIGCMAGMNATPLNLALVSFLIGFGGLSVHCQTLSVLSGTNVKCARHFVGRIFHGGFSALYTFLLFTLLRI